MSPPELLEPGRHWEGKTFENGHRKPGGQSRHWLLASEAAK